MSRDVLEHNLQRLLTRAYVPVKPRAAFVEALRREVRAQLDARSTSRRVQRVARPTWYRYAAAAAAVLVIGIAYALLHDAGAKTSREIVARGQTAVRSLASDRWRALSPTESAHGIECASPGLEVATASASDARVWVGSEARVDVLPSSVVRVESAPPQAAALHVDEGGVSIERYGGVELVVHTAQGDVALERGTLSVAYASPAQTSDACVRVRSESGIAWALQGGGRTLLGLGTDVFLCSGRVLTTSATFDATSMHREPLAPQKIVGTSTTSAAPLPQVALAGRVHAAGDTPLPKRFDVFLLAVVRLPNVARAHRASFDVADVEASSGAPFAFASVADGTYTVFVQAAGFAVWQTSGVDVVNGRCARELDVRLDRGGMISGRVIDAVSGLPVASAVVLVEEDIPAQLLPFAIDPVGANDESSTWSACTLTGPDGRFELAHVSRGSHLLRASAAGHAATWSESIEVGDAKDIEPVTLTLGTGGTVFGSAAHEDGTPFVGAHIVASYLVTEAQRQRLNYGYALTDAAGRFAISDLPAGGYVALNTSDVRDASKSTHVVQVQVEAGKRSEVHLPGRARGTRLVGRVQLEDGTPVADADVSVIPAGSGASGWQAARSDTNGAYVFPGLAAGRYELYLGREFGRNLVLVGTLDLPDAAEFTFDVRAPTSTLRGVVTTSADGAPLSEAVLILERETVAKLEFAGRAFSDRSGRFALEWVEPGRYRVSAFPTHGRLGPARSELFSVVAGAPVPEITLALAPGSALHVQVRDGAGKPVVGAAVTFVDESGETMRLTLEEVTDAQGRLTVSAMRPGRWLVRVHASGRATVEQTVEVSAGELRRVELTLAP